MTAVYPTNFAAALAARVAFEMAPMILRRKNRFSRRKIARLRKYHRVLRKWLKE